MFFKNRCYNSGRKHNYKARYDIIESNPNVSDDVLFTIPSFDKATIIEASKATQRIYKYDICTWCGDIKK